MIDTCHLRSIQIPCRIGIDPWEETTTQVITVHLRFPVDAAAAARTDDIASTTDYRALSNGLYQAHEGKPFRLVETAAESIATWILTNSTVAWIEVTVEKPLTAVAAKLATIQIRRERQ